MDVHLLFLNNHMRTKGEHDISYIIHNHISSAICYFQNEYSMMILDKSEMYILDQKSSIINHQSSIINHPLWW